MPLSRPPAADLVETVREFLERDILPTLAGDRQFHCRVAINILAMVRRELELGPALDAAEHERLRRLLGQDGSLAELNRRLAALIRSGAVEPSRPDLLDHLRRTIVAALEINNPKWLGPGAKQQ
jgi:Domain of unknown function (DUF6285)